MLDFLKDLKNGIAYINPNKVFNGGSMQVLEINESDSMTESLGITKERSKFLLDLIYKEFRDESKEYVDHLSVAIEVSKHCNHPNELFYISGIISEINLNIQIKAKMKDDMDNLMNLFKKGKE